MLRPIREFFMRAAARAIGPYLDAKLAERWSSVQGSGGLAGIGSFNERQALGVCSFWAAVRLISELCAALPLEVQERVGSSNLWQTVPSHPLEYLLNSEPNTLQTGLPCHEMRYLHTLIHGQSPALLRLSSQDGSPLALWPVHPSAMTAIDDPKRGRLYQFSLLTGDETVDRSEVVHLMGPTLDGVTPLSPLRLFANNLQLANGARGQAASFWSNVPRPGMIVTAPGVLSAEKFAALEKSINTNYTGWSAGKAMLLEGGLQVKDYQMSFSDYQLLELLAANDKDIGEKIFRLPPSDLKGFERDDYLAKYTICPFIARDEQELTRKLLPFASRGQLRIRRNIDELMRPDIKTRMEAYRVGVMAGILRINEVRGWMNLEPDAKGNELYLPQSVYGKPGTTPTVNPVKGATSRAAEAPPVPETVDPRFQAVLAGVIDGLFQREIHAVERFAKKPTEWKSELTEFYSKHRSIVANKAQPLGDARSKLVLDAIARHESALLSMTGPDLGPVAERLTETWSLEACQLATAILEP